MKEILDKALKEREVNFEWLDRDEYRNYFNKLKAYGKGIIITKEAKEDKKVYEKLIKLGNESLLKSAIETISMMKGRVMIDRALIEKKEVDEQTRLELSFYCYTE